MTDRPMVSVFGSGDPTEESEPYWLALATGRTLAELGYAVANGGYGGTMEASARGARQAGGWTVGVTCGIWQSQPNGYLDEVIRTESLPERMARLIEIGRCGYVVLPGANGTLAELACVWERKSLKHLADRPLVFVGRFWQPLIQIIASQRPDSAQCVATVDSPSELSRHFPRRGT